MLLANKELKKKQQDKSNFSIRWARQKNVHRRKTKKRSFSFLVSKITFGFMIFEFEVFFLVSPRLSRNKHSSSQTATTATGFAASRVSRGRRGVLNAANLHATARQRTQRCLCTRTGRLGLGATSRADLDVQRRDAELLASLSAVLRGKHCSVRRRLVAVGLHLLAAGHANERFAARQISDVHKRVVERGVDARNAKNGGALLDLWAKRHQRRLCGLGTGLALGAGLSLLLLRRCCFIGFLRL